MHDHVISLPYHFFILYLWPTRWVICWFKWPLVSRGSLHSVMIAWGRRHFYLFEHHMWGLNFHVYLLQCDSDIKFFGTNCRRSYHKGIKVQPQGREPQLQLKGIKYFVPLLKPYNGAWDTKTSIGLTGSHSCWYYDTVVISSSSSHTRTCFLSLE